MNGAFGNYRDLMRDVTLNPAMGRYLNMLNNQSQAVTGSLPNENYARELMQLFTIGIPKLDQNGTPAVTLLGTPAHDLHRAGREGTGAHLHGLDLRRRQSRDDSDQHCALRTTGCRWRRSHAYHDKGAKVFLGQTFPANQTARQDLDQALDLLFNDPNVGPFVASQLIQQLVTSNPSKAYVADVAAVFNDNGGGVRGDLAAVVRAILTHPEAGVIDRHVRQAVRARLVRRVAASRPERVGDRPSVHGERSRGRWDRRSSIRDRCSATSRRATGCAAPRVLAERRSADPSSRF